MRSCLRANDFAGVNGKNISPAIFVEPKESIIDIIIIFELIQSTYIL